MLFQKMRPTQMRILLFTLSVMIIIPIYVNAHETEFPGEKLNAIFPEAKKFVPRSVSLTKEKIASIEKELGTKLRKEDLKPIFYIPISPEKKPLGLVLFVDAKGPHGTIEGSVGLNMKGKVVRVTVYEHKETDAIASEKFLKQFIGKGIDDAFKVGDDIEAIKDHEDVSAAVAIMPKKTLVMSYALFLKRKPKPDEEKKPKPEETPIELPEVEDLKELMNLMIDDYFVILDYFDKGEGQAEAVTSAKKLAAYTKLIAEFEPPKNADKTEEYTELQEKFSKALIEFAEAIEKHGITDDTRKQWEEIDKLVNQSHIRFKGEEIDLESY